MSPRINIPITTSQLNNNTTQQYQHIVYCPPNHIHYTVSTITKFHPQRDSHMIPTSIDLDLQKAEYIPTTSTTTFSHIPSVRNTSSNFTSTFHIPISTSLQQNTTSPIRHTSNQQDPLATRSRSKNANISLLKSALLKATNHKIPNTNSNNINTKSVTNKKKF